MRISDWSSDVCSSDLQEPGRRTEKPVKKPANQCATGDSPDQFRQHAITEAVSLIHPLLRAARPDRLVLVCLPEPLFQRFQPAVLFVRVSPGFSAHHQCTPSCRLCFRPAGRGCKDECWITRQSAARLERRPNLVNRLLPGDQLSSNRARKTGKA